MSKKLMSFLLSILFVFSFQSNSNAMKRFFSACYTKVSGSSAAGEPDLNRQHRMEKSERITVVIRESSVLLGQMFKESLELAFKESFEKVKTGLIKENKVGQEVLRIGNQILEEILLLIFSRIDSTITEIQRQPNSCELKTVVMKIFSEKVSRFSMLAKEKCKDASGQKKLIDMIIEFISSSKPAAASASSAASSSTSTLASEIDLKKVEHEVREFVTKNAEQIKMSTDVVGFLVIILGRLAPMLPELLERFSAEIPVEFQALISDMGGCFAEQIGIFMESEKTARDTVAMKAAVCERFTKLLEEKIFKKISEILKPYVQRVLSGMVEDFAPTGTRSVINTCATLLVSRKLDGVIEESSKKIRTWLDTNNQDILDELNRIISQIIAVE